jgi:hypothetical protein
MFVRCKVWFKTKENEDKKRELDRLGLPYKKDEDEELNDGEIIVNTDHITRINIIDNDGEDGSIIWINEGEAEVTIRTPHPYERWIQILHHCITRKAEK